MKKYFLLIALSFLFCCNVNADEEAYYTNNNGLDFTEYQYNFFVDTIGEDATENMGTYEYNLYEVSSMNENNHSYNYIEDAPMARSTYLETGMKKLAISKTCNASYCIVSVINTWKSNPSKRSYDVIGVRLANTSFYDSTISTVRVSGGNTYGPNATKGMNNGAGSVVKLPTSGNMGYISQVVHTNPGGRVYGSYQHATKNISLAAAKSFSFSAGGIGGVFSFPSSYGTMFDEMSGVYIDL